MNTFLDIEWSFDGRVFLYGYARSKTNFGFLYGERLTAEGIFNTLAGSSFVFVWGPDIGKLEREFDMEIKSIFRCVNLLSVVREFVRLPNYRLETVEYFFDIKREVNLKAQRGDIYNLWRRDPKKVLKYNMQDVLSLVEIYEILRRYYGLTAYDFRKFEMS